MKHRNFISLLILSLAISSTSAQVVSTDIYDQYLEKLSQLNSDINHKAPLGHTVGLGIEDPCGHKIYNPAAFDPEQQAIFEGHLQVLIAAHKKKNTRNQKALEIPVVVHVIHQGEAEGVGENIPEAQVMSQITALNDAFNRSANTRYSNTENNAGLNYTQLTGSADINFVLAQVDPDGNPTNGINRVQTVDGYHVKGDFIKNIIKPATIWNPDFYLNIWSARLTDGATPGLLGFAVFPGMSGLEGLTSSSSPNTDGIVADFRTLGSNAYANQFDLNPFYQFGVTVIHEVGHFLGLRHVWGDGASEEVGCSVDDFVNDTPNSAFRSSGCDLVESCSSIDLNENYMDYGSDVCKNIFTNGQIVRMQTVLENSPRRLSLLTSPILSGQPIPEGEKPTNDLCQNAPAVRCGQTINGSTLGASVNGTFTGIDGRLCSGEPATQGVWYSLAGAGQVIELKTSGTGTDYDATVHVFSGSCGDLICEGGHDDQTPLFSNTGSDLVFLAENGASYFIYISGREGETGHFTLTISCNSYNASAAPANDKYHNAVAITCGEEIVGTSIASSIDAIGSGQCGVDITDKGVWYRYQGTGNLVTVSTCTNVAFDTKLAIFDGSDSFWGCFAKNDNGGACGKGSLKRFFGIEDKTYLIWVGGAAEGAFTLNLSCGPAPEAPVNITFSHQHEIDSFPLLYPATSEILGDVVISHDLSNRNTIIRNIAPLLQLNSIGGNLIIQENIWDAFNNLEGLDSLKHIGGDLIIHDNAALRSLDPLSNLKSIGGDLLIDGFSLISFDGLRNLISIGGSLSLDGRSIHREEFPNFNAFNSLASLGEDLVLKGFYSMDTLLGFEGLEEIPGDLIIEKMWSILRNRGMTHLAGFPSVVKVGGNLEINENQLLQFVGDFPSLTGVGGDARVYRNNVLKDLSGLTSLQSIGGDLISSTISGILETLTGLTALDSIGGKIHIGRAALADISGLDNLSSVGDSIIFHNALGAQPVKNILPGLRIIGKTLYCSLNLNVPHFSGFSNLEIIGEDVIFTNFSRALEISGFNQLRRIGGSFLSTTNALNEKLSGFENLREVGASFEISRSTTLRSLEGFSALETIGEDFLIIGTSLADIPKFESLKSIDGSLVVDQNPWQSHWYMDALETIGADLNIGKGNNKMTLFSAKQLVSIGGDFTIGRFNFDLDTFVMPALETIHGSFQFDSLSITKLIGMDNLAKIGGDFIPSTSLFSFENTSIQSVGGNFILDTMKFIRQVDELQSLTEIGGDLIISRSPKLKDLSGFGQLVSVGGNVLIAHNAALDDCSGICTVVNKTGIVGSLEINNNAAGCNDFAEVEPACAATPTEDLTLANYIRIFPNPVGNQLQIKADGLKINKLVLFDIAGRELSVSTVTASDFHTMFVDHLSSGVYLIRVSLQGGQRVTKKVVKE